MKSQSSVKLVSIEMQIKFVLIFTIILNNWCSGSSVENSARLKRLMSIDVSKLLNNNYKSLPGAHSYRSPFDSDQNKVRSNSVSKSLNIDLSALRPKQETVTTTPKADSNSELPTRLTKEEQGQNWNDQEYDVNRVGDDLEEYDYYQPLRIIPHSLYFNVWSPQRPGYDALTDFLHDEHQTGRLLSNGKRDLYSLSDWVDNTIPIFPQTVSKSDPCPYLLPEDYGITCEQFMSLLDQQNEWPKGNSIFKRDMFLSKGWGPSGSYINLPSKSESKTKTLKGNNLRKLLNFVKIESNILSKSQGVRQKQDIKHKTNSLRWSIPHLFGAF